MKQKYKITFIRITKPNWFMVCTRTLKDCYRIGFKHLFKGHAIFFIITKHNNNENK